MILGSNKEQDQTTCHIQEWQLWLFLLLELSPLLVFEFDFLSLLCNTNTLRNILMMLGTNVEQDEMMCCIHEWQLWRDWGWGGGWGGGATFVCFFSKKSFLVFIKILKIMKKKCIFFIAIKLKVIWWFTMMCINCYRPVWRTGGIMSWGSGVRLSICM